MVVRDGTCIAIWKQHYLEDRTRSTAVIEIRVNLIGRNIKNETSACRPGAELQQAIPRLVELERMLVATDDDDIRIPHTDVATRRSNPYVRTQEIVDDIALFGWAARQQKRDENQKRSWQAMARKRKTISRFIPNALPGRNTGRIWRCPYHPGFLHWS